MCDQAGIRTRDPMHAVDGLLFSTPLCLEMCVAILLGAAPSALRPKQTD